MTITFAKGTSSADRVAALQKKFLDQVKAFRVTPDFFLARMVDLPYSFRNQLLLLEQMPEVRRVATYKGWLKLGRQVVKGQRALYILGPVPYTERDEETGEDQTRIRGFRPLAMFDYSQTEPINGFENPFTLADPFATVANPEDTTLWELAQQWCARKSIGLSKVRTLPDGADGVSYRDAGVNRIRVRAGLPPAVAGRVAWHEIGHIQCGHLDVDYSEYQAHRGRCEVEAETFAAVLARSLGFPTLDDELAYVKHWMQAAEDEEIVKAMEAVRICVSGALQEIEAFESEGLPLAESA